MIPRPQGQADVLRHLARGREFVAEVMDRRRQLIEAASIDARPAAHGGAGATPGSPIHLVR
jgi:hypothetical protein